MSSPEFKELVRNINEIEDCFIFLNRRRQKKEEGQQIQMKMDAPIKASGEKRYVDAAEYFDSCGPPKQKQLRPTRLPDYGDVPSSTTGAGELKDY